MSEAFYLVQYVWKQTIAVRLCNSSSGEKWILSLWPPTHSPGLVAKRRKGPLRPPVGKSGMRFGWQFTVSYSFKQTSKTAFFFVLQNVSKSKKCQFLSALDEHNIHEKKYPVSSNSKTECVHVCVCAQTLLRASTLSRHTPHANSLAFLMPCLRIQEEKSRELSSGCTSRHTNTHTQAEKNTQTNFTSCYRVNAVISILIITAMETSLLTVNISEPHQLFKKTMLYFNYVEEKQTPE